MPIFFFLRIIDIFHLQFKHHRCAQTDPKKHQLMKINEDSWTRIEQAAGWGREMGCRKDKGSKAIFGIAESGEN